MKKEMTFEAGTFRLMKMLPLVYMRDAETLTELLENYRRKRPTWGSVAFLSDRSLLLMASSANFLLQSRIIHPAYPCASINGWLVTNLNRGQFTFHQRPCNDYVCSCIERSHLVGKIMFLLYVASSLPSVVNNIQLSYT